MIHDVYGRGILDLVSMSLALALLLLRPLFFGDAFMMLYADGGEENNAYVGVATNIVTLGDAGVVIMAVRLLNGRIPV
jgi:hypothetical protein